MIGRAGRVHAGMGLCVPGIRVMQRRRPRRRRRSPAMRCMLVQRLRGRSLPMVAGPAEQHGRCRDPLQGNRKHQQPQEKMANGHHCQRV
jgi:hypothetical protein